LFDPSEVYVSDGVATTFECIT